MPRLFDTLQQHAIKVLIGPFSAESTFRRRWKADTECNNMARWHIWESRLFRLLPFTPRAAASRISVVSWKSVTRRLPFIAIDHAPIWRAQRAYSDDARRHEGAQEGERRLAAKFTRDRWASEEWAGIPASSLLHAGPCQPQMILAKPREFCGRARGDST